MEAAVSLYRRAIALDPNCALAYALLARTLWIMAAFQWIEPSEDELDGCVDLARTAVRLGQADPEALGLAAHIIALPGGELTEGIASLTERSSTIRTPPMRLAMSGTLRAYLGDTVTALRHLELAERLTPIGTDINFKAFGFYLASLWTATSRSRGVDR